MIRDVEKKCFFCFLLIMFFICILHNFLVLNESNKFVKLLMFFNIFK